MSDEQETPRRKVPLWVKLLLGISLALNLAVLGLVGGIMARIADRGPGAMNYAIPYVIALPKEDRKRIDRQIRRDGRSGSLPSRRDRMDHYRNMLDLLASETWDGDQAQQILIAQADDTIALQKAAQSAWLETLSGYSTEERAAYAERLRAVIERGPRRKPRTRKSD